MNNGLNVYYGDLHNHCNIGYAHGSLEDSFQNARLQLDFACVTVHAHWHDIPRGEPRLDYLVDYHEQGFARTADNWQYVKDMVARHNASGEFVAFLGFEWHSNRYGDHNVYFKDGEGDIIRAGDMEEMRACLRDYAARGIESMLIPHHIGYKAGYRGINWAEFDPEFIPVVEIMSMHGASESPHAPRPYLHTMGPRDWQSSLQYGLQQGAMVGVVGSTDHHSAHPGSYGHGKLGVWAAELSRDSIWQAIHSRRTFALTGDRIALQTSLNDTPMGSVASPADERQITVDVTGGDTIDYVEIVHNNRVVHHGAHLPEIGDPYSAPLKVYFEMGWGERDVVTNWQGALTLQNGELLSVEPRFRGYEIVAPQATEHDQYAFSRWQRTAPDTVEFTTRTWGNMSTTTASTQGLSFEFNATPETRFTGVINGQRVNVSVADLIAGPRSFYLGGFVSPAFYFHRAVPQQEYTGQFTFNHRASSTQRDWYYVRVRQKNDHWAWSSPTWVEPMR